MNMNNQEYNQYIMEKSPKSTLWKDCLKAFCIGGLICVIGQLFIDLYRSWGADQEIASSLGSITLVFISALLTGLGIYPTIAKHGGAGTLVPITGFSNAVTAPAIEAKTEGFVLGVGAKIFTIAGPVILYGTLASIIAGICYWIMSLM